MRPSQVTRSGVGTSNVIPVDYLCPTSRKGVMVDVTGTATYTVEITLDDVFDTSVAPVWLASGVAALTGATTDQAAEITIPCRAIRVNQTVGAGSSRLLVLQQSLL